MKKVWFMLFIFLLVVGSCIYVNLNEKETTECTGDTCEIKEEKEEYKWSNNKSVKVNSAFNYETNDIETGYLKINDGILEFVDLKDKVIKTYDYFDSNIKTIEKYNLCDNYIYLLLTEDNKLYRTDNVTDILADEPFFEAYSNHIVNEFLINGNNDCNSINLKVLSEDNITDFDLELN